MTTFVASPGKGHFLRVFSDFFFRNRSLCSKKLRNFLGRRIFSKNGFTSLTSRCDRMNKLFLNTKRTSTFYIPILAMK